MPGGTIKRSGGHFLGAEPRAGVGFFTSPILFSVLRQFGSKSHREIERRHTHDETSTACRKMSQAKLMYACRSCRRTRPCSARRIRPVHNLNGYSKSCLTRLMPLALLQLAPCMVSGAMPNA